MWESKNHDYWNNRGQKFDKDNRLKTISQDFLFNVSVWRVEGYRSMSVIWINPNLIQTWSLQQTVSPQGWQYTFPATDVSFYISSTSTADIANTFALTLLDSDYNEVNVLVTPNGRNAVLITWWTFLRLNACINASWTASQWDIYISTSSTNTNWVPPLNETLWRIIFEDYWTVDSSAERIHNSVYTVPAWKTLFTYNIRAWLGKNKDAVVYIYIRPFGWVFIENIRYQLYEGNFENALNPLTPIPEKTDIDFRATTANNATELTVNTSFILVDNDKL